MRTFRIALYSLIAAILPSTGIASELYKILYVTPEGPDISNNTFILRTSVVEVGSQNFYDCTFSFSTSQQPWHANFPKCVRVSFNGTTPVTTSNEAAGNQIIGTPSRRNTAGIISIDDSNKSVYGARFWVQAIGRVGLLKYLEFHTKSFA